MEIGFGVGFPSAKSSCLCGWVSYSGLLGACLPQGWPALGVSMLLSPCYHQQTPDPQ